MLIDFDAEKTVKVTGQGKVIVKPVVKLDIKQKPAEEPVNPEEVTEQEGQNNAE
jgi:hypothetical protein